MAANPSTPIGDAIGNAIDGNEPVAVGAAVAALYNAAQIFAIYKGWVTAEDVLMAQPLIIAAIALGAVLIRKRVASKASAEILLNADPMAPTQRELAALPK